MPLLEVEDLRVVLRDDRSGDVLVADRRLRAAGGQRTGTKRQQREQEPPHDPPPRDSPCWMSDVWSVVALATPCSVWTITES